MAVQWNECACAVWGSASRASKDKLVGNGPNKNSRYSLTFIAQTREAYGLLTTILTKAHGGKEKGHAELTLAELIATLENHRGEATLLAFSRDLEQVNSVLGHRHKVMSSILEKS